MRKNKFNALRVAANWIQRILNASVPMSRVNGVSTR
jgi:hypothetical protein